MGIGSSIIDSESVSERGLVDGSVFSRLFMDRDTGSTSKRLMSGRFATGRDSIVGKGLVIGSEGWSGLGMGIASQSVVQRVPSWAFWVIISDESIDRAGDVQLSFPVRLRPWFHR